MEQTWLTEAQVSERTGFAKSTLQNWRSLNRGPEFRKVGRCVRYSPEAVEKFMTSDAAA